VDARKKLKGFSKEKHQTVVQMILTRKRKSNMAWA